MTQQGKLKMFKVAYSYMGVSSFIKVEALDEGSSKKLAMDEIEKAYGTEMAKLFTITRVTIV
jgi:hypothetical protein